MASATWYNDSLPFLVPDNEAFFITGRENKYKRTQIDVIKVSTLNQSSLDVWGSAASNEHQAEIGEEDMSLLLFLLSRSLFMYSICEIKKKPLSPGNRSCATQMVPSLFKWEAEPLSAVVCYQLARRL